MKKITRLLATAALLFGVAGGVNSVKAKKVFATLTSATETWTSTTNTFSWTRTSNNYIATQLPKGDISAYTNFHCIVSDFSENASFIRLVVKNGKDSQITEYINAGEFSINLVSKYSSFDFTCVTDILLFGSNSATDGHSINNDNPASVVITEVYMEKPDAPIVTTTASGFGDEITDISYITSGNSFVIGNSDGTKALYFDEGNNSKDANVTSISNTAFFTCTLEKVDDSGVTGDNIYKIRIKNLSGTDYTGVSSGQYLNTPNSGWSISFSGLSSKEQSNGKSYGQDNNNHGLWYITYETGNGFTIQNVGKASHNQGVIDAGEGEQWASWLKVDGLNSNKVYLKFYKSIDFTNTTMYPANDEIFALSKATRYDAETGEMTNGTWTFATPVDISNWSYLMITTVNSPSDPSTNHAITIKDGNDVSVSGEGYEGSAAGTGGNMWLDRWNNQNAIRISIDYLKNTKGMDITKIKSLTINGTTKIANVYLTDYNNTKINGGYSEGDVKREYSVTGKYGTICLPYKASYAGADIYSISGKTASGISLTKVTGLLEAGKPYFYVSTDENGQDNGGTVRNVNFFRADFDEYDSAQPITSNGLIGTFTQITAPEGENYCVLSKNKIWTVNSAVTIGANKAYIDMSKITDTPSSSRSAFIAFDNTTGISDVNTTKRHDDGIYDLSGRRVTKPTKGVFIMNGRKVVIK